MRAGGAPGRVRVDCHLHTMWSGDSSTTPDELAAAVGSASLDVVCVTDHSTIAGALELVDVLPCRVVVGQEQRTPDGELIGLFLSEAIPAGLRSAREAALHIRAQGGVVYVPHPFDAARHGLRPVILESLGREGLLDVVEVFNAKTTADSAKTQAIEACERLDLLRGAGSDAHVPSAVGAAFVEMDAFEGARGFCSSLRGGKVFGRHFDPPRTFEARIVPSTAKRSAGSTAKRPAGSTAKRPAGALPGASAQTALVRRRPPS